MTQSLGENPGGALLGNAAPRHTSGVNGRVEEINLCLMEEVPDM